ncbi:MAG TPA: HAD hydrolase-like protein [Solirubrobacteraceae bacterium]
MAVIFDFDGVLVDSVAPVTASINAALHDHGLPQRSAAQLRALIGPPTFSAFAELLGRSPDDPYLAEVVATYRTYYEAAYLSATEVFEGVPEMLAELSHHHPLAVATSKSSDFAQPLLDALGLAPFFTVVAAADPRTAEDDKSAIVARALAALGESGGAMVGDRSFDMAAARSHGLRPVGVAWGIGTEEELRAAGAEVIAAAPDQLLALLVPAVGAR